ncbi:hypothetical protein BT93_D1568 [Corymbia citriodora subsp. variegata]|nr:hypothetical protein BT93_D1568 [Corymbia citriodora subsp. variegata]
MELSMPFLGIVFKFLKQLFELMQSMKVATCNYCS